MKTRLISVLLVVPAIAAAGCGGSKSTTTTAAASSSTAATTTSSATATSSAKGSTSFASSKNCVQLAQLGAKISQAMQAKSGGDIASSLKAEERAFGVLAAAAPDDIKGDFETFGKAFGTYADALGKSGFKAGTAPSPAQIAALTKAAQALATPKLQAAEQHLSSWAHKNCGGLTTTTD